MRRGVALACCAVALALAGCGGGGGGDAAHVGSSAAPVTATVTAAALVTPPAAQAIQAAVPEPVPVDRYDAEGWARWQQRDTPVFSGPYALVGDPSVLRDGPLLRMFHTCYDVVRQGPAICQATSTDGIAWTLVQGQDPLLPGRMLSQRPGKWDDTHETPLAIKFKGEYLLYFAGYQDRGGHLKSFPIQIGLATSVDGEHFSRESDDPVLTVSPTGLDPDAVFSPTIVEHDGHLVMLYTAYCLQSCTREPGVYLLAATSDDGRQWTRTDTSVIDRNHLPPGVRGIAEAHVIQGPDQQYYLFATYLYDSGLGHEIGIGRAPSPLGPWQMSSAPIVRKTPSGGFADVGPIAPTVLIEDGQVRMWFHGFSAHQTIEIGYAQTAWPLHAP